MRSNVHLVCHVVGSMRVRRGRPRRTVDMAEEIKAEIVANVLNVLVHERDSIADGDTVVE